MRAAVEPAERPVGSLGCAGQPHPEHVDRRAEVLDLAARPARAPSSAGRRRRRSRSARTSSGPSGVSAPHADDAAAVLDQVGRPRLACSRWNAGIALAPASARKSRKSHCGMKAMNWQRVGRWVKSATVTCDVADARRELARLLVRPREELVEQAELVHDLQRRGVDGVAAEVAQEVGVLLEHDDVDAGAREQEAEHHPGRTAAGDAAAGAERAGGVVGHGSSYTAPARLSKRGVGPAGAMQPVRRRGVG